MEIAGAEVVLGGLLEMVVRKVGSKQSKGNINSEREEMVVVGILVKVGGGSNQKELDGEVPHVEGKRYSAKICKRREGEEIGEGPELEDNMDGGRKDEDDEVELGNGAKLVERADSKSKGSGNEEQEASYGVGKVGVEMVEKTSTKKTNQGKGDKGVNQLGEVDSQKAREEDEKGIGGKRAKVSTKESQDDKKDKVGYEFEGKGPGGAIEGEGGTRPTELEKDKVGKIVAEGIVVVDKKDTGKVEMNELEGRDGKECGDVERVKAGKAFDDKVVKIDLTGGDGGLIDVVNNKT